MKTLSTIALLALLLLAACAPRPVITPQDTKIKGYLGETVRFAVDYFVPGATVMPSVAASCDNLELVAQDASGTPENGTVTAGFLIVGNQPGKDCVSFDDTPLAVSVEPLRQAVIQSVINPKKVVFDEEQRITVGVKMQENYAAQELRIIISSKTKDIAFGSEPENTSTLAEYVLPFDTARFQSSAEPVAFFTVPDAGFSEVTLQPIVIELYIAKNSRWYMLDSRTIDGLPASK
ncbi:hypothetical protein COY28_05385 [Candidatus Woesearchaeota archaeon CG_4_10_14_0_2_um_filter_57_5]|nr:MAG: hypothetical protein AUJ68_01460 [Candidatus Woesearchaeota archaeon CG1_02_57_44]PIZ50645.1 MAG: hypothetical protein COY28_05385 [Candidatus Woesearchaeota archaeon CG_4_10_14_0_2_um_filter_57_5]